MSSLTISAIECLRSPACLCRASLSVSRVKTRRFYSVTNARSIKTPPAPKIDIEALLSKPTWSVQSLLPTESDTTPQITPAQLHHLLRLSALPQPKSPEEEAEMLKTLQSQLHFVKEIQSVDTTDVEPLQAIRDETEEAILENTIGVETLKEAFANEEVKGRNRRPRRRRDFKVEKDAEEWDVLGTASRTVGKYFVVKSSNSDTQ